MKNPTMNISTAHWPYCRNTAIPKAPPRLRP